MPIDLVVSVLFPLHGYIGMNWVFTDYVSPNPTHPSRAALLAITLLSSAGMIKLSMSEDGVLGSVKKTWVGEENK